MDTSLDDLLPPIFDKVASHFAEDSYESGGRADIIDLMLGTIIDAVASNARDTIKDWSHDSDTDKYPELVTVDRLSGGSLSHSRLIEEVRQVVPLGSVMVK